MHLRLKLLLLTTILALNIAASATPIHFTEAEGYRNGSIGDHRDWWALHGTTEFQVDAKNGHVNFGSGNAFAIYTGESVNFDSNDRVTYIDLQFSQTEERVTRQTIFAALAYLRDHSYGSIDTAVMGLGRSTRRNGYRFVGFGDISDHIAGADLGITGDGDNSDIIRVLYLLSKGDTAENWTANYIITNLNTNSVVASGTREMLNVGPKAQADSSIFGAMNLGKQLNGIDDLQIISYGSHYVSIPEVRSLTAITLAFSLITTMSLRRGRKQT
ncbi:MULTISPECIES: hypothetical protein [unclassified Lentimonas]|uniref:hypothetical protein n=1 Tax=unclassified Lentimonas TaxID=2630993 RepID=UPI0013222604|nr:MULTISPECIES: hypothetical protein [unclassified Lentimonas]CAA6689520.1 Unannotated [Lentimonas sp. CC10]CAA6691968.1 Unannotated [Lentimonas sp. CC19]CAA7070552.1 Unannotated [Lentimonas sp. CC11]